MLVFWLLSVLPAFSVQVNQATQQFKLDDFLFEYTDEKQLVITRADLSQVVWQSQLPFISVDFIKEYTHQIGGVIKVKENQDFSWPSCTDQSVLSITQGASLVFKGRMCANHTKIKSSISYVMTFSVDPTADHQLLVEAEIFGFEENLEYAPHVVVNYNTQPDEKFFGFGEQYTYLDLRGQNVPMITREKGTGRGLEPLTWVMNTFYNSGGGSPVTSYMAVPFYFTSKLQSLYFFNTEYMEFDLDSKNTSAIAVRVNATSAHFSIIARSSYLDIINEYTKFSGRMRPLPKWVGQGAIVGLEGGTDAVKKRMEQLKEVDPKMPVAGVWFQDWSGLRTFPTRIGLWWNWELDGVLYHNWTDFVQYLQDYSTTGVRVLTYVNPMLADVSSKKPAATHNYKKIASDAGYLVKEAIDKEGKTAEWEGYNSASLIDLSNPKAREFLKGLIKDNMISQNHSGWMADFAESYPLGAVAYNSSYPTPSVYHNMYPVDWQTINKEAIEEMGMADEILYFCRSGSAKSPSVTSSFWVGDQLVSWDNFDGIKAALTAMLSLGMSGFSLTHSDTGGYVMLNIQLVKYIRTKELFCRWAELSAFTAIYRTHPGTLPDSSWQFYSDNSTLIHYSRFAKVYVSLADYRETLMQEAYTKGYPLMRPMFLHYPADTNSYATHLQFMLGSEFIVAPVLDPKIETIQVYLPAGSWVHVWSNQTFVSTAQNVSVSAPIGEPGLFFKAGSAAGAIFVSNLKKWGVL